MKRLLVVVVLVVACSHGQSTADRCRAYKDALIVALDNPHSTDNPVGLSDADAAAVTGSRRSYVSTYAYSDSDEAKAAWRTWADHFQQVALARRGC